MQTRVSKYISRSYMFFSIRFLHFFVFFGDGDGRTFRADGVFAVEISMRRTNAKCWREREVGKAIVFGNFLYECTNRCRVCDSFAEEAMKNGSASILYLQIVLKIKCREDILSEANGELG